MTSGSSSASSPMGVTNGLTHVMASATIQVAPMTSSAAAAVRPRTASTLATSTRMPPQVSAAMSPASVRESPTTSRSTTSAATDPQIATRLTPR